MESGWAWRGVRGFGSHFFLAIVDACDAIAPSLCDFTSGIQSQQDRHAGATDGPSHTSRGS
jgi:hypothetical protein